MKQIKFSEARRRLLVQWLIFSAITFVIFLVQMLTGRYEHYEGDIWNWLFTFITPPLSLMIGVFISQITAASSDVEVDVFYFRLASWVSYFFLVMLLLSAFLIPIIHLQQNRNLSITDTPMPIIEAMKSYNILMLPLQGICTLTLGLFFAKK